MHRVFFGSFILVLCAFWTWSFAIFHSHFNGPERYLPVVEQLQKENRLAQLQSRLLQEELFEYQQQVASLLPKYLHKKLKGKDSYPLRQLASTVRSSDSDDLKVRISETYLVRGKTLFRQNRYAESHQIFDRFIARYPYSPKIAEAYFLLVESCFHLRKFEEATKNIRKMVALFPDNEFTGYALIRLAQIYEVERYPEEAANVYQTVMRSFPYGDITSQAAVLLQKLEL